VGVAAVFLDRDGTLNQAVAREHVPYGSPRSLDELRFPEDAVEAVSRLKTAGFLLIGATNQPEVPRGQVSREAVEAINEAVASTLGLDEIFVCWHDDVDACDCRKPKPGLLLRAAAKYGLDLSRSFMVGDRCRDAEAGQAAGCRTIVVDQGWAGDCAPDARVRSLAEAADWILTHVV
jgi:D-glycero-D-manno-heptose 1,7-bisphosphate phosphatase